MVLILCVFLLCTSVTVFNFFVSRSVDWIQTTRRIRTNLMNCICVRVKCIYGTHVMLLPGPLKTLSLQLRRKKRDFVDVVTVVVDAILSNDFRCSFYFSL